MKSHHKEVPFSNVAALVSEIKRSEELALSMVEKAKVDSELILSQARAKASEILKNAELEIAKEKEKGLNSLNKSIDDVRLKEMESVSSEISLLEQQAKKNKSKANSHIVSVFEEMVDEL